MSFGLARLRLIVCLGTILFLGASLSHAQRPEAKDGDAPAIESKSDATESAPETEANAAGDVSDSSSEMTADEVQAAELDAKKEEENASLRAKNDAAAQEVFRKGLELEREGSYRKAAKRYLAAELLTSDKTVKANALANAARAFRQAELYGQEFDCIERLIKEHMGRIDFTQAVNREYEIADAFYRGHRDAMFEWLPFIKDSDRFLECSEAALENAPCAESAGAVRLRLGSMYLSKQQPDKAIEKFKEVLELHPGSDSAYYAELGLADVYCQLAERGDGDGHWAKEAIERLDHFSETHPEAPEIQWVKEQRLAIDRIQAKRLHDLAKYYHRNDRDDLAEHYLSQVVQRYAETEHAIPSEKLLAEIDETYEAPPDSMPRKNPARYDFVRNPIPLEDSDLLITPENSDGKWLLPIRDIKKDVRTDSRETYEERAGSDDAY
jgi:outer membrane protein assembly factor BamD (BamD/ComL family)